MIAIAETIPTLAGPVAQTPGGIVRASDRLREDAAGELSALLSGVTGKQIDRANVPTCGKYAISRALNAGDNNPIYRIAMLLLLMKRLGMGRARALWLLGVIRDLIDAIWPEEEGSLEEVLEKDSELDPQDDHLRFQAAHGCEEAKRALLEVKRRQVANGLALIPALRRRIAAREASR